MMFGDSDETETDDDKLNQCKTSTEKDIRLTDAQKKLSNFWPKAQEEVKRIDQVDAKNQALPLARIKKIMKLDENSKMIAAEAPLLFAKAAELFIQELTLRAWIVTEEFKRRTLQKSDIAAAIAKYDQFDFLIDIVPREEIKPLRKENDIPKTTTTTEQLGYYLQLAQQQRQVVTNTGSTSSNTGNTINTPISLTATTNGGLSVGTPQGVLLTTNQIPTTNPQTSVINNIQNPQQQIQLLQQIVTPTGEITHVPITITQNQLNLLRMQMQSNAQNTQPQQVLIPTLQAHQAPLVHVNAGQQNTSIFLNTLASTATTNDEKRTNQAGNTFRTNC